ncbi:MAG: flagellar basal-body rod protein FlgF [Rickettsiales bacterium]|nr:flagellar basal-body rod protein FlgF [Rickettsiales bacterium]|tara:strand:- start:930 stop:1655 length:726 start_codon:yes stop_codon:yes gene_type:complete
MENTGYIVLSRQASFQRQMDVISNNIANANTTGYKARHMMFEEHLSGGGTNGSAISMVNEAGQFTQTEQGPLQQTHNTFDFALQGPGFFKVEHSISGETYYTRAGNFTLNRNNELVTPMGHRVMGDNGAIVIPTEAKDIRVSKSGVINSSEGELGRFSVVEFDNQQGMRIYGQNLWATEQLEQNAENTQLNQGMLEGSNVNTVTEMTNMIEVSRLYQMNQNVIKNEHDRIRNAINKLGKIE